MDCSDDRGKERIIGIVILSTAALTNYHKHSG